MSWEKLAVLWPEMNNIAPAIREQVQIDSTYSAYMGQQEADIVSFKKEEGMALPHDLDYSQIGTLSTEIRMKLESIRPATLGAASRIPGVTPAAVVSLLRFVKRQKRIEKDQNAA